MCPNPNINRRLSGSTGATYDVDAQLYFNQLIPQPSVAYKEAINTLVLQFKADGNWTKLDRFWIHATEFQQHARVSLANPSSTQVTEVNSPTWTTNQGFTGNGTTQYLNTNYNYTTNGVQFTLNSGCQFIYSRSNVNSSARDIGADTGVNLTTIYPRITDIFYAPTNENGGFNGAANADSRGLFAGVRTTASATFTYKNGAVGFSRLASNPAALINLNLYVLCVNSSGAAGGFSTRQIALSGAGSGAINQATFYSAIQAFATTRSFQV